MTWDFLLFLIWFPAPWVYKLLNQIWKQQHRMQSRAAARGGEEVCCDLLFQLASSSSLGALVPFCSLVSFVNRLGGGPACLPGMLRWCLRFAVEMTGEESCQITPPDDKGHFSASAAVTKGKAWSLQLSQQVCTLLPSAMCFLSVWSLQGEASVRVNLTGRAAAFLRNYSFLNIRLTAEYDFKLFSSPSYFDKENHHKCNKTELIWELYLVE